MVHQELPRAFGTSMLESTLVIDTSESRRFELVRLRFMQYLIARASVKVMPLTAQPSLYGNRRKGSRGNCTLFILSRLCIDPNLRS